MSRRVSKINTVRNTHNIYKDTEPERSNRIEDDFPFLENYRRATEIRKTNQDTVFMFVKGADEYTQSRVFNDLVIISNDYPKCVMCARKYEAILINHTKNPIETDSRYPRLAKKYDTMLMCSICYKDYASSIPINFNEYIEMVLEPFL